ncbi:MAG: type 2 isopentenyl-diphosphate Delta-isomerase [Candidatus Binatia bacterium]
MRDATIERRKRSHLDLCANGDVEHLDKTTLFEDVDFVHDSLSEVDLADVDLSVEFVGRRLGAPFLITGMTGGTADAAIVNRDLARLAERFHIGFGLGSQRAMLRRPELAATYSVRREAPSTLLLANLGLNQAAQTSTGEIRRLVDVVGADGLCIHLNPAQELVQKEGDREFAGGLTALERIVAEVGVPVIVKETGCGISAKVGRQLERAGIRYVDVSGAGGTSWVRVEDLRGDARSHALGQLFRDWGIPTAASLVQLRGSALVRIASGGIRNALDAAKALALGATICGFALPVFRAYRSGGLDGAAAFLEQAIEGLRVAMVLTGSRTLDDLRRQRIVIGPRLERWIEEEG